MRKLPSKTEAQNTCGSEFRLASPMIDVGSSDQKGSQLPPIRLGFNARKLSCQRERAREEVCCVWTMSTSKLTFPAGHVAKGLPLPAAALPRPVVSTYNL